jgi:DnaK suppressor protein
MADELPEGYRPSEDEEYMSLKQLEYFRQKLNKWREQLIKESNMTREKLKEEKTLTTEIIDRGTEETSTAFELRTRDRYRKLIRKIEKALDRIEEGSYGYCEETGVEIGLKRLEARPIATLSIEAQERHEREEKRRKA